MIISEGISHLWTVEHKTLRGEEYIRVVLPSFEGNSPKPELALRYYRNGRVVLDSDAVSLQIVGLYPPTGKRRTVSLELLRTPLPEDKFTWDEKNGPEVTEPDRISSEDLDYI